MRRDNIRMIPENSETVQRCRAAGPSITVEAPAAVSTTVSAEKIDATTRNAMRDFSSRTTMEKKESEQGAQPIEHLFAQKHISSLLSSFLFLNELTIFRLLSKRLNEQVFSQQQLLRLMCSSPALVFPAQWSEPEKNGTQQQKTAPSESQLEEEQQQQQERRNYQSPGEEGKKHSYTSAEPPQPQAFFEQKHKQQHQRLQQDRSQRQSLKSQKQQQDHIEDRQNQLQNTAESINKEEQIQQQHQKDGGRAPEVTRQRISSSAESEIEFEGAAVHEKGPSPLVKAVSSCNAYHASATELPAATSRLDSNATTPGSYCDSTANSSRSGRPRFNFLNAYLAAAALSNSLHLRCLTLHVPTNPKTLLSLEQVKTYKNLLYAVRASLEELCLIDFFAFEPTLAPLPSKQTEGSLACSPVVSLPDEVAVGAAAAAPEGMVDHVAPAAEISAAAPVMGAGACALVLRDNVFASSGGENFPPRGSARGTTMIRPVTLGDNGNFIPTELGTCAVEDSLITCADSPAASKNRYGVVAAALTPYSNIAAESAREGKQASKYTVVFQMTCAFREELEFDSEIDRDEDIPVGAPAALLDSSSNGSTAASSSSLESSKMEGKERLIERLTGSLGLSCEFPLLRQLAVYGHSGWHTVAPTLSLFSCLFPLPVHHSSSGDSDSCKSITNSCISSHNVSELCKSNSDGSSNDSVNSSDYISDKCSNIGDSRSCHVSVERSKSSNPHVGEFGRQIGDTGRCCVTSSSIRSLKLCDGQKTSAEGGSWLDFPGEASFQKKTDTENVFAAAETGRAAAKAQCVAAVAAAARKAVNIPMPQAAAPPAEVASGARSLAGMDDAAGCSFKLGTSGTTAAAARRVAGFVSLFPVLEELHWLDAAAVEYLLAFLERQSLPLLRKLVFSARQIYELLNFLKLLLCNNANKLQQLQEIGINGMGFIWWHDEWTFLCTQLWMPFRRTWRQQARRLYRMQPEHPVPRTQQQQQMLLQQHKRLPPLVAVPNEHHQGKDIQHGLERKEQQDHPVHVTNCQRSHQKHTLESMLQPVQGWQQQRKEQVECRGSIPELSCQTNPESLLKPAETRIHCGSERGENICTKESDTLSEECLIKNNNGALSEENLRVPAPVCSLPRAQGWKSGVLAARKASPQQGTGEGRDDRVASTRPGSGSVNLAASLAVVANDAGGTYRSSVVQLQTQTGKEAVKMINGKEGKGNKVENSTVTGIKKVTLFEFCGPTDKKFGDDCLKLLGALFPSAEIEVQGEFIVSGFLLHKLAADNNGSNSKVWAHQWRDRVKRSDNLRLYCRRSGESAKSHSSTGDRKYTMPTNEEIADGSRAQKQKVKQIFPNHRSKCQEHSIGSNIFSEGEACGREARHSSNKREVSTGQSEEYNTRLNIQISSCQRRCCSVGGRQEEQQHSTASAAELEAKSAFVELDFTTGEERLISDEDALSSGERDTHALSTTAEENLMRGRRGPTGSTLQNNEHDEAYTLSETTRQYLKRWLRNGLVYNICFLAHKQRLFHVILRVDGFHRECFRSYSRMIAALLSKRQYTRHGPSTPPLCIVEFDGFLHEGKWKEMTAFCKNEISFLPFFVLGIGFVSNQRNISDSEEEAGFSLSEFESDARKSGDKKEEAVLTIAKEKEAEEDEVVKIFGTKELGTLKEEGSEVVDYIHSVRIKEVEKVVESDSVYISREDDLIRDAKARISKQNICDDLSRIEAVYATEKYGEIEERQKDVEGVESRAKGIGLETRDGQDAPGRGAVRQGRKWKGSETTDLLSVGHGVGLLDFSLNAGETDAAEPLETGELNFENKRIPGLHDGIRAKRSGVHMRQGARAADGVQMHKEYEAQTSRNDGQFLLKAAENIDNKRIRPNESDCSSFISSQTTEKANQGKLEVKPLNIEGLAMSMHLAEKVHDSIGNHFPIMPFELKQQLHQVATKSSELSQQRYTKSSEHWQGSASSPDSSSIKVAAIPTTLDKSCAVREISCMPPSDRAKKVVEEVEATMPENCCFSQKSLFLCREPSCVTLQEAAAAENGSIREESNVQEGRRCLKKVIGICLPRYERFTDFKASGELVAQIARAYAAQIRVLVIENLAPFVAAQVESECRRQKMLEALKRDFEEVTSICGPTVLKVIDYRVYRMASWKCDVDKESLLPLFMKSYFNANPEFKLVKRLDALPPLTSAAYLGTRSVKARLTALIWVKKNLQSESEITKVKS